MIEKPTSFRLSMLKILSNIAYLYLLSILVSSYEKDFHSRLRTIQSTFYLRKEVVMSG